MPWYPTNFRDVSGCISCNILSKTARFDRYNEAPRCQGLAETLQGGQSRKNRCSAPFFPLNFSDTSSRGLLASSSPHIALTSQFRAASQPSSMLFYSARCFPPLARFVCLLVEFVSTVKFVSHLFVREPLVLLS